MEKNRAHSNKRPNIGELITSSFFRVHFLSQQICNVAIFPEIF